MNRQNFQEQLQGAVDTFTVKVFNVFVEALTVFVTDINEGLDQLKPDSTRKRPLLNAPPPLGELSAGTSSRRTIDELAVAGKQVVKLLQQQGGGMRIEEINRALGTSTRQLMRPVKMLLQEKRIKKTGQRRSTTYFAA